MIAVNGKPSAPAPVTLVVAPLQAVPNTPPGYYEVSRWHDGAGYTVLRCWPVDHGATRMEVTR
jgi:hypothetical protein